MIEEAAKALDGWLFYLHPGKLVETNTGLIEYAIDTHNRLHIIAIYTAPKFRRQGYAEGMLRMLESEADDLIAWTSDINQPAIKLFLKLGYSAGGKIESFYPNGDGGIMWRKQLNATNAER